MSDRIDFEQVREAIRIAQEADLAELEIETPALKVRIRKAAVASAPDARPAPFAAISADQVDPAAALTGVRATSGPPQAGEAGEDRLEPVLAPMVGTFYRAASPDAPPLVLEGDVVEVGRVLCVIEAMKLFNEIQAETRGRIARVLVDNASPVEYGQPLFLIDTGAGRG